MATTREINEAELKLLQLQDQNALWALPLLRNSEVPIALGIGETEWYALKRNGDAPPHILIGGCILYRTSDLKKWIDNLQAKKNPGVDARVSLVPKG